jgi:hypothetical protein
VLKLIEFIKKNKLKFNIKNFAISAIFIYFCFLVFLSNDLVKMPNLNKLNLFKKIEISSRVHAREIFENDDDISDDVDKNFLPNFLRERSFLEGYDDKTFKPDENLTYAEASQMIYKLIYNGTLIDFSVLENFFDVNKENWYSCAIAYLESRNFLYNISGSFGDINSNLKNFFKPNTNINRAEFSQLVFNLLSYYNKNHNKDSANIDKNYNLVNKSSRKNNFKDIKNNPAKEAIINLQNFGILDGYGDNNFLPNKKITRAEAVKIITKVFRRRIKEKENIFIDLNKDHWAYKLILSAT